MVLNEKYYLRLNRKYSIEEHGYDINKITFKIIGSVYNKQNVYFNFPKDYDTTKLINSIYEELSKFIFKKYADLTGYNLGDKLKNIREKGSNIYVIIAIKGDNYTLKSDKDDTNLIKETTFDKLKRNYKQIKQSARLSTIQSFIKYFEPINKYGFTPQHFSKKVVLIGGQKIYNNLKNKKSIPTIYLPNTRDGKQIHSIEAFEDCIAYITPKYAVCYEELLLRGINIDTIVVCNSDLNSIPQIISDKTKYKFNLIILSNENKIQKPNGGTLWNWQKEEIEFLEQENSRNIDIECIENADLENYIQHFEACIQHISTLEMPIKLKDYGYYLRFSLNALQEEQFDYLLMRLKNNKELERNEGGYEDFGKNNPKEALTNLILHLKNHNLKINKLKEIISNTNTKSLFVVDRENLDYFQTIRNRDCKFVTQIELKKLIKTNKARTKTIVFCTFNGCKDFEFIYNLPNNLKLVLYEQEKNLYYKQIENRTKVFEEELTSSDRFSICGIKYEPIEEEQVKVSQTLEQIIERLDQRSDTAYEGYKTESDSLLDDLEEDITYKIIMSNGDNLEMGSYETVFNTKNNFEKVYRLKEKQQIRIYPKEELAENLFQIAIEVEPEKFGKIDEHSAIWLKPIIEFVNNENEGSKNFKIEQLYNALALEGLKLKIQLSTFSNYVNGRIKFPMYNEDLRKILKYFGNENTFAEVKKSKRLYNSTMIALGRGIKQELQHFLKKKTIGDILQKKNFTADTLQEFINKYMPLLTIIKIEKLSDEQQ